MMGIPPRRSVWRGIASQIVEGLLIITGRAKGEGAKAPVQYAGMQKKEKRWLVAPSK